MRSRLASEDGGNSILEFAIVSLLFILLTTGILEMGRAVWAFNSLSHAAREGARFAIVRGGQSGRTATGADVQTYVRSRIESFSPVNVFTTWSPDDQPGSVVEVEVQYTFQPAVPLFPSIPLTTRSRMVISF